MDKYLKKKKRINTANMMNKIADKGLYSKRYGFSSGHVWM